MFGQLSRDEVSFGEELAFEGRNFFDIEIPDFVFQFGSHDIVANEFVDLNLLLRVGL